MEKKAIVVGAGLVGSLWAVMLGQRGYAVDLYERRPDVRKSGFAGGRSINLAMSVRGWRALEKIGMAEVIGRQAIPMHGRMMHDTRGELTFQPYGKKGQAIYSVSRGGLNLELLELADTHPDVHLHFDQRCQGVDLSANTLHFRHEHTGKPSRVRAPLLFGTDGAFSMVRDSIMKQTRRFNYSQQFLEYGYKELHIPPTAQGRHRMEPNALHIWPRGSFMLIALPNADGSFTCTLFLAYEGKESFARLHTDAEVTAFFERQFPDVLPLMPDLLEDFRQNPTADLVTIRCNPWHHDGKALLLGDASHAIVPFYGQGMNAGFEDCSLLDALVDEYAEDWSSIIPAFSRMRIPQADAIADLALRNFIEMRDKVADPDFLLRKKIAARLHEQYPEFLPLYSMVSFSHLPYDQALREGQAQDAFFERVLQLEGIEENWADNPEVNRLFEQWWAGRRDVLQEQA